MFKKTLEDLKALGAHITTQEIKQQPEIWLDTLNIFKEHKDQIDAFLDKACALGSEKVRVVFTGAGTSAYVGDTVTPYLTRFGNTDKYIFESKPTTDIVSCPLEFLHPTDPTVLVSFARSGNSPESLAAVKIAEKVCENILFINITCAPEGKLAVESKDNDRALTILIPKANDQGFAMTGSYSCMTLLATLIFDESCLCSKEKWVSVAASMGEYVIEHEDEVLAYLDCDFNRVTYLGSGALGGLTREAQLKVLELAAGKITTSFDTSLGYRHGPKSFVDNHTIIFDFVSNDSYTRQYDLDILYEIAADGIALHTVAIQQATEVNYEGEAFTFGSEFDVIPDGYFVLPCVLFAQTISLATSLKVKNTPDTPSANGTVNRVVKGVTIHEYVK